jgi:hypothetical protein
MRKKRKKLKRVKQNSPKNNRVLKRNLRMGKRKPK